MKNKKQIIGIAIFIALILLIVVIKLVSGNNKSEVDLKDLTTV